MISNSCRIPRSGQTERLDGVVARQLYTVDASSERKPRAGAFADQALARRKAERWNARDRTRHTDLADTLVRYGRQKVGG